MDLRPWRQNNIWKLLRNDSGVILDLLEITLERISDQKVNIWNMFLDTNSPNCKIAKFQNLVFKSQHLVMNPGQGPCLKCAPGQDSIKDSSIIKSCYLRRRVMAFQNSMLAFWADSGWGKTLARFAIRRPRINLRIF